MKEYNAYLFDVDGTILDTRELIYRCIVHMGGVMGVTLPDRAAIEATTGLPVGKQLRQIIGGEPREDAFYERAVKAYGEYMMAHYMDHLRVFPGVAEGLAELSRLGKKLAIVTSRRRHSLDLFLGAMGILEFFPVRVTPENTEKHKPDPEPARFALRLLGARAEEAVFVGDAEFDIRSGKGAGTATAYVEWGGMDYKKWPVQPDFVAGSFQELLPER